MTPSPDVTQAHWLRDIVLFLGGQIAALFGSSIVAYTVVWYITLKTGSGSQYALLMIASQLTQGLTSIPGGVWADRYWRKALIMGADAATAVVTLALAIFFLTGHHDLWLIVVVLAMRGLSSGVQSPAINAALPQLVPTRHLMRVNSINSAAQSVIFVAAPALAAVLLATVPLGLIFLVDVAAIIVALFLLFFVRLPRLEHVVAENKPTGWRSYVHDTKEAIHALAQHPGLVRVAGIYAFLMCVLVPVTQLTPVFITRYFGPEQWMLAAAEITWSVGMVIGGVIMSAWGGMRNRMALMMIVSGSWVILTALLGASPNIWFFCVVMVSSGVFMPFLTANTVTATQERIAPAVLGRVMSLFTLTMAVSGPIGMAVFGPLSDTVSLRLLCFIVAACTGIFLIVLQLRGGPGAVLMAYSSPPEQNETGENVELA